jgi:hypothetical protein
MNFAFLIFCSTFLHSAGVDRSSSSAAHAGDRSQDSVLSVAVAVVRRPGDRPCQLPLALEGVQEAASEEDSSDIKILGVVLRGSLDLMACLPSARTMNCPAELLGLSRSPSRSPLLRC